MDGPRQARPEEIEAVTDLVSAVFGFSFYDREYMLAGMRRPVMDTARIIAVDGAPVSYIHSQDTDFHIYGCRTRVASIGCVCTREDQRNKGYADAILVHQMERHDATGVRLMVVSGGRGLYRRHHCVDAGRAFVARVTPDLLPSPPEGLSVRRVTIGDWPLLAPLYQAEPAHFVRPADLEQNLCFWWNVTGATLYLVEDRGTPVAYAALARQHWRDPESLWIMECAGSRAALLDAAPLLLEAAEAPKLGLCALAQDTELRYRLSHLGVDVKEEMVSGTIRLINLPGLMDDLRDYVAARVPAADLSRLSFAQKGETCTFRLGPEEATLGLADAARLVCGGPDAPAVEGHLGRVLSRIFPLPTIQPGLNFV